jgi:Zn-dependent protease
VKILDSLLWYVVFILSVTVHEAAHAWAAKKGGDLTAYSGGQVSLNPLPHIKREPLGMVVLPIISSLLIGWPFGYASTPYDRSWAHDNPRKASWMAAAGPAANVLLLLFCTLAIKVGILLGIFVQPDSVGFLHIVDAGFEGRLTGVTVFVSMLFTLNLILAVLNLTPFPPFDGSGVVSLLLSNGAARKYRRVISNPAFGFVGLLLVWQLFGPLFRVVFVRVINILYWGSGYA